MMIGGLLATITKGLSQLGGCPWFWASILWPWCKASHLWPWTSLNRLQVGRKKSQGPGCGCPFSCADVNCPCWTPFPLLPPSPTCSSPNCPQVRKKLTATKATHPHRAPHPGYQFTPLSTRGASEAPSLLPPLAGAKDEAWETAISDPV